MKNLFGLLFVCALFALTSCGGDSCDLVEFTTEADESLALGTAYNDDQTKENCDAYADKLQSIIDDYGDCDDTVISAQVATFQTALDGLDCM